MSALVPELPDADRAAVMVMLLEERQAAGLLAQLEPHELTLLGERMVALGEVGPAAIGAAIAGFVAHSDRQGLPAHGRPAQVRALMTGALGEVKAAGLIGRVLPDTPAGDAAPGLARWLDPETLLRLIEGEHPQAIAALLVQLDPRVAARVLNGLPFARQPDVVHRVATLGPVGPEALALLEELLERRIAEPGATSGPAAGGPREAAGIVGQAGKATEKRVLPDIAKADKVLARAIENEMFKFEHLYALDPQAMGALLREVESEVLIDALKGLEEGEREPFFAAMSSRAADGVRDEIAARGRLKHAEVEEAQRRIVAAARRLAADGAIDFGAADDGEYV